MSELAIFLIVQLTITVSILFIIAVVMIKISIQETKRINTEHLQWLSEWYTSSQLLYDEAGLDSNDYDMSRLKINLDETKAKLDRNGIKVQTGSEVTVDLDQNRSEGI